MPVVAALRDRAVTTLQSIPRRARRRVRGRPVRRDEVRLVSTAGYQIHAWIHRPADDARAPGVLLTPGTCDPGSVFEGWSQPLNAREVASRGYAVMTFDPAGRGESWGEEDYGGPEHQDNVRVALRHLLGQPFVEPERVGVVSISLGVSMACGALARWPEELPVAWLVDWEGPCDREIITAGGRIMAPAMGHALTDEVYWKPRESARHVGRLRCGYVRVQAARDHAQPGEFRHAERMIRAAAEGALPWFRINEHPPGEVPPTIDWYPAGRRSANRVLLRWIDRLHRR